MLIDELSVQRGRDAEDPPALLPRDPPIVGEEGGREIAHHHPPAVAVREHRLDPVVELRRHPGKGAGLPQQGGSPAIARHPAEPVRPRADSLRDQARAVGEDHPLESGPRVAAVRQRDAPGAGSEPLQKRLR